MTQKEIEKVSQEFLPRYKKAGKKVNSEYLADIIQKATKRAKVNYKKLKDPRTCNLETYTSYWIYETLLTDFIYKTWPKKPINHPEQENLLALAMNNYFKVLPLGGFPILWKGIHQKLETKGEEYTRKLYLPILKKGEKLYPIILQARNQAAKKQGYKFYIDQRLSDHKISLQDYQYFLDNKDKVIKFCQANIPQINLPDCFYSQFQNQCFLCQLVNFPKIPSHERIIELASNKYPILKKFQQKIKIKKGKISSTTYIKEVDSFEICLSKKNNRRHNFVDLIHELSHVISQIKNFQKGIDPLSCGKYFNEVDTFQIEFKLLKKISRQVYQTEIAGQLKMLSMVLFEIESYNNPDQNLSRFYAKIINLCFPQARQRKNYSYLIEENMIMKPFRSLPHAVAVVKILSEK